MSDFDRKNLSERKLAEFRPIATTPAQEPEHIEEEYNDEGSSFDKFRIIAPIIVLAIVCFISYAWYTDKFAISRDNSADIPVIKASAEPLREKPEDPGGLKIVNRDKRVYDTISGKDTAQDKKAENILPAPEEPISQNEIAKLSGNERQAETLELINSLQENQPADVKDNAKPENITPSAGGNSAADANKDAETNSANAANTNSSENKEAKETAAPAIEKPAETKAPEAKTEAQTTAPVAAATNDNTAAKAEPVKIASAAAETAKPAASEAAPATPTPPVAEAKPTEKAVTADDIKDVAPKKAAKPEEKKAKTTRSGYRIQLGSYKSEGDLELSWKNMKKKFPAILSGMSNYVEKKDLGAKGIYYRLQVSGFKSEDEARKTCKTLTEKKQECLFVGK